MKQSIKTITAKKILSSTAVVIVMLIILIAYNFYQLTFSAMTDKAQTVASFVETGLIRHMNVNSNEEKDKYKKDIQQISNIQNLQIIPSSYIIEQFQLRSGGELSEDKEVKKVFYTKNPNYILPEVFSFANDGTRLRVVFPYIAQQKSRHNCLGCHDVPPGTVLGAVDFYIDIDEYKNMSVRYLFFIIAILIFILAVVLYLIFHILEVYVKNPLDVLIEDTRNSYEQHKEINIEVFESAEIRDVAQKINLFNTEVIEKNKELESTQTEIIHLLGNVAEKRSKETAHHVQRVAEYSYLLAKHYGLGEEEAKLIRTASPMHDIGKVGIPDSILKKPGKLTDEEFETMKKHVSLGFEIFKDTDKKVLKAAAIIARYHHEKWNGEGYDQNLKGEDIHIYGRITSVADVFDALSSKRVYKQQWDDEKIVKFFKDQRGKHFDPKLVDILLENMDQFLAVKERFKDENGGLY